ncbi:MAG: hypothetical protein H6924_09385 [Alphaproteobacteria bacterium]|nr:hypothetical protein [Alphaproteobacteria bacterium]
MTAYQPLAAYVPGASAPGGSYAPPPAQPAFQLADLIAIVHARRALIAKITLGVVLLAVVVALSLPTKWSSSAEVMLDQRRNTITDLSAVLSQLPNDPATLQNQIRILTSRELAGQVVDQQNLLNDPEFNAAIARPGIGMLLDPRSWFGDDSDDGPADRRDRVIDAFLKHVTVTAEGLSTAVTVTVTSKNPEKAARLANALSHLYVESQVSTKVKATAATTDWLNQRLQDLAQQLQLQEEAIQRYKAEHGLTDSSPGNSLVDQQLSGINAQIVQARSDLAEKQAIKDRIDQLMASGNAADIGQIVSSPLIVQLRTQQAELLREEGLAASKYGPLHPKMQAIQAQKRDLDLKITQEVSRLAASASNDVMVAKAHLSSLQSSLGGAERTANTQNLARVQLQALQSNADSTRTQYEAFVQRLRQSQNTDQAQTPDSQIISAAAVPDKPSGPKRKLIVGASLPLGLMLGLLTALLLEKVGPLMPVRVNGAPRAAIVRPAKPRTPPKAQAPVAVWSGPPILADIADTARLTTADFVIDHPTSKLAHALAGLVRQLEAKTGGAAVVALTSADFGENRAAIAASLARAAARMGKKTIIVDCAPQGLAGRALKAPVKNGLYEVLTGKVPLNQALAKDPRGQAYLLGCPNRPPNAPTMFSSRQMARLISILRGGADFVVIDCGSASLGPDAALLARQADATVLVARRQALHAPPVANAAKILQTAKAAPVGIVVTR